MVNSSLPTGFAVWRPSLFLSVLYFQSSVKWSKYMKVISLVFYQLHLCSRFLLLRCLILGLICLPMPRAFLKKILLKIYFWWWQVDTVLVMFSDLVTDLVLKANLDSLLSWLLFGKFWIWFPSWILMIKKLVKVAVPDVKTVLTRWR